jgi:hypothetical protein
VTCLKYRLGFSAERVESCGRTASARAETALDVREIAFAPNLVQLPVSVQTVTPTIVRTDHMVAPREIRVRLRWADGHIDTLPEPINSNRFEVKQQDSTGAWHSFDDANEVDEEGYLIFAQED